MDDSTEMSAISNDDKKMDQQRKKSRCKKSEILQ